MVCCRCYWTSRIARQLHLSCHTLSCRLVKCQTTSNIQWSPASVCLCVCLSAAACQHYCANPDVTWRNGRACPRAWLCTIGRIFNQCMGFVDIMILQQCPNAKCQRLLVLALCLILPQHLCYIGVLPRSVYATSVARCLSVRLFVTDRCSMEIVEHVITRSVDQFSETKSRCETLMWVTPMTAYSIHVQSDNFTIGKHNAVRYTQ